MNPEIKQRLEQIKNGKIPEGYSRSKLGIFPKDWSVVSFDDKFSRLDRKNDEDNQNVLTISAQQGLISQQDYYNSSYASENKKGYSLLYKGDFSYNKSYSGDYLYGAIKRLDKYEKGIVSPLYICFEPKEGTNSEFYLQYFEAGLFNGEIYKIAQEGARNHGLLNVSVTDFFKTRLINPPGEEQQKIAEVLMQCDKVIELKKKRIEDEKKLLKYLMKRMLTPNVDVEVDEVYFKCRKCRLEDLCDISTGDKDVQNKAENGKYPFFIRSEKVERIDTFSYDGEAILIPGDGKIGEVFHYINGKFDYHQRVYKISDFNKDCIGKFIYYYLILNFKRRAMTMTAKATVDSLRRDMLTRMEVLLPNMAQQIRIVRVLDSQNSIIEKSENELKFWQQKKKSLMQLMLTGIVRVK